MLESVLQRIEAENEVNPVWIIGPKTGHFLYWLLRVLQPEHSLEVGTSVGYSALWLASALEENQKGKLWTIESHKERFHKAQANIAEAGLGHRIHLIQSHAPEIFFEPTAEIPEQLDFVFLDATKEQTQDFFDALYPRIKKDGLLVVDNVHSHRFGQMEKFLQKIHKNPLLKTTEIPVGAGLLVARIL